MKKACIFLFQLAGLILICKVGYLIAGFSPFPIPGNVIGMVLLFVLLQTKIIKLEWIDLASGYLVKHLAFFFIPIAAGLMDLGDLFVNHGIALSAALAGSLIIGLLVSAFTTQTMAEKGDVNRHENAHHHL
jgi:holin-like protein